MHAIETVALTKRFGRVKAVNELDLQVAEGSVYALMGPNGAGKTTLIKMLMNLLRPSSGKPSILGRKSSRLRGRLLEDIGYVSENQKLPDWMSVGAYLRYWRPFYPTWDRELEKKLVERFDLPLKRRLKHLSRGMRMKAVLASVLAYHPKLIVLDEPLSGLDPLVRDDLMEGLLEQASETTVFISSHDLAEIDSFASHVGYMQEGRLRLSEPMANIRERFRAIEVTSNAPLAVPADVPAAWLQFSVAGLKAQWTESAYDREASQARIREVFGAVETKASTMTLREVFLTMARSCAAENPKGGTK